MTTLFVTGIDTNIGKTVACGVLANSLINLDYQVASQKWVETGCEGDSQDLAHHQKMVSGRFNTSHKDLHSPYRFRYPASPHLAAELEDTSIDSSHLIAQTKQLENENDHLIIEGAGGLCVPLDQTTLVIDLIATLKLPILLVSSGRLGSINHTLLSLQLCWQRGVEVRAIIYNHFPQQDEVILNDTRNFLKQYLIQHGKSTLWLELDENATQFEFSTKQLAYLMAKPIHQYE